MEENKTLKTSKAEASNSRILGHYYLVVSQRRHKCMPGHEVDFTRAGRMERLFIPLVQELRSLTIEKSKLFNKGP